MNLPAIRADASELNAAIERLEGIKRVQVITGENGVEEIHVLAQTEYRPKTLVRNIETLLLVQFGIRIDHRCISIVQVKDKRAARASRPVIHSVGRSREGGRPTVTVELQGGSQRVRGISRLDENTSELESGSLALISAVQQLPEYRGELELREIGSVTLYGKELVFVVLSWNHRDLEETLVGATLAGPDLITSAARATLDALNRKLARLAESHNS